MIYSKILLGVIIILAGVFTYLTFKKNFSLIRIIQPFNTILIIVVAALALLTPGSHLLYIQLVMLGLIFSLGGDCNLIDIHDKVTFLPAVFFYWAGLITYSVIFTRLTGFEFWELGVFVLLLVATGITIAIFFWKKMGDLKLPIIIYSITWCFLLSQTLTIFWSDGDFFSLTQKWLIAGGTALYYLGDLNLSFHKFNAKFIPKTYWLGPLLYWTGQTLIALNCSYS